MGLDGVDFKTQRVRGQRILRMYFEVRDKVKVAILAD